MELVHIQHGGIRNGETLDGLLRTLRTEVVPRSYEEEDVGRLLGRGIAQEPTVIMERARLVIVEKAAGGEYREFHRGEFSGLGLPGEIERLITHVIEPYLHERELPAAAVRHPPVVLGDAD